MTGIDAQRVLPALLAGSLVWLAACAMHASIGGWRSLARRLPAGDDLLLAARNAVRTFRLRDVRIQIIYNMVDVTLLDAGILLRIVFLLRPFHPPIFIPWSRVDGAEATRIVLRDACILDLEGQTVTLYGSAAREVDARVNSARHRRTPE